MSTIYFILTDPQYKSKNTYLNMKISTVILNSNLTHEESLTQINSLQRF